MRLLILVVFLRCSLTGYGLANYFHLGDSMDYMHSAKTMRNFEFLNRQGIPETFRTPGYPFVLAVFAWF